jgi:hypothetical protein
LIGRGWHSWLSFFIFSLPFADLIAAYVIPDPRRLV